MSATIINTKIGIHRGKKRIFLEGRKLERQGIKPGMFYNITIKDSSLNLELCETGKYKVSRRKHRSSGDELPVFDISTQELAQLFDEDEQVRVLIQQGKLVISTHHQNENIRKREERLLQKLANNEPLKVCSLFHGGGVLDTAMHYGMSHAGIKTKIALAVERDGRYLESSLRNNAELWDENSIVMESTIEMINIQSSKKSSLVDALYAGIPCTGSSLSGKSKNKIKFAEDHSEAGSMFFYTLEMISQLQPPIVVLENVPQYSNTASMSVIRSVLDNLGYTLQERIFNGVEFGALENRDRLVVVALSKGIDNFDIEKVVKDQFYPKPDSINDVLEDIDPQSDRWKDYSYLAAKEERDIKAGKGFSRQLLTGEEAHLGTIGKGYAKARSTEPFITHPTDKSLSRLLTPKEHAAVKVIPEKIISGLSSTVAHEILGQSIIFSVFDLLGIHLGKALLEWADRRNQNNVITLKQCA